jgi:nicotinamidase-related amidase
MERQALLLIDVQREYFDLASPLHIPDGPAVLDRLVVALAAARSAGLPVIHVRHEESGGIGVFEPGSPNVEIMADVAPLPGEPVVLKHLPGAFDATDLEDLLAEVGAQGLIIGGFMTHMCVDTTTREALIRAISVTVLADGTATRDLESPLSGDMIPHDQVHEATLAALADGFAKVLEVEDVFA